MGEFGVLDWGVVIFYFAVVFGVAVWSSRVGRATESSKNYFLAGGNVGWFVVGASVFASNIGSEHLVGLAGSGASSGLPAAQFEILAALALLALGWLFVPFYLASGVFTMPEFLERRYSSSARTYLAVISIIGYVLTKISVTIAAGGIVFEALMGIDFWTGAIIVVVATGVYTMFGGLRAVLYTDAVQMVVLLGGAVLLTYTGLEAVGGWSNLTANVPEEYFSVWRPTDNPDYPWTGILFGAPILAVWYWCTDQYIVQRVLSANGIATARRSTIVAGLLKQLPLFIFVLPGIIALALSQSGALQLDDPDKAYPTLINALMPAGLKGLIAAALLAALMSSLSSVFNSCSAIITIDIYKRFHTAASERRLVVVGQVATLVLVVFGLMWVPFIELIQGGLFKYLQSVQGYIAPPIAAVFLVGILWPRVNSKGAMATMLTGLVLAILRLWLETSSTAGSFDPSTLGPLSWFVTLNFLHMAFVLFVVSIVILVSVSLATEAPETAKLKNLTLSTTDITLDEDPAFRGQDRVLTGLLIALIAAIWIYFS